MTAIQGFSRDRLDFTWVYRCMSRLPATLIDPAIPFEVMRGLRARGQGGWRYSYIGPAGLMRAAPDRRSPFWVAFSASEQAAALVASWQAHQRFSPIHASLIDVDSANHTATDARG